MSKSIVRLVRRLGRKLDAMGGFIWICQDCHCAARRVHEERFARYMAIYHVEHTAGHSVRILEMK